MVLDNSLIRGRIGSKISGNIESKNTLSLLEEFLDEEEIWGYTFPRPTSLDEVWNRDWESLLKLVAESYKKKIVRIHPDINSENQELATQITTIFNILKTRIKKKINPTLISSGIQFVPKGKPQTRKFCPNCKKAFEKQKGTGVSLKVYCCKKCRNAARMRRFWGRKRKLKRVSKKCECGIIFFTTYSKKTYHSRGCMRKHVFREWAKKHPERKH